MPGMFEVLYIYTDIFNTQQHYYNFTYEENEAKEYLYKIKQL